MKKRVLAILLALAMVAALLPVAALANEDTKAPSGDGIYFFANGTPITITKDVPNGATAVTTSPDSSSSFAGFTATGLDAYISWEDGTTTKYIGVSSGSSGSASGAWIFGGGDGTDGPIHIESTSITMESGEVWRIYAGNLGKDGAYNDGRTSTVTTAIVTINDGEVVDYIAAGRCNSAITGTVSFDINNLYAPKCYVHGGIHGNGNEGSRENINDLKIQSTAVVKNAIINVTDSNIQLLGGGGGGTTITESSTITVNGGTIGTLSLNGINGLTQNCTVTVNGAQIKNLSATNRGLLGTATATINNTTVADFSSGAAIGCFGSDSGTKDASGVVGHVTWRFGAGTSITGNKQVTPTINKEVGSVTTTVGNQTIIWNGRDRLQLDVKPFAYTKSSSSEDFAIASGTALDLQGNASLNVVTDSGDPTTLTNKGTLNGNVLVSGTGTELINNGTLNGSVNVGSGSQLINNAGATITGPAYGAGKIANYGVIDPKVEPITSDLVVTRQYDGSSQPVQIRVTLGRILTGSYGGHYFDHGVGVFTLQPGQSLYFHDLPANMTYDVAVLDGLVTAESNMSGTTLPNLTNSMYTNVTFAALPGVTPPDVVPGEEVIIEGEEEIITPGEEEGDVQEGTEETAPEEGETPEEGLEELPEEGEVPPEEEPVDVPKTGDVAPSIGLALMLGLAACAVVLKKARAK